MLADETLGVAQLRIGLLRDHGALRVPGNTPRNPLDFLLRQRRDTALVVLAQKRMNKRFLCHPIPPYSPRHAGEDRVPLAFWDDLGRYARPLCRAALLLGFWSLEEV
jgi:hypothetical protein